MIRSIVKDSTKLKKALKERWKALGLTQEQVSIDATNRGYHGVRRQAINKYLKNSYQAGALNEEQIVWLALRWDIPLRLEVGYPEKQTKFLIPTEYNEARALKNLLATFPEPLSAD